MTTFTEQMQERARKEFWRNYAGGGMTPSTPDNPPEGWEEWKSDPSEVEDWVQYLIADTITATLKEVERVVEEGLKEIVEDYADDGGMYVVYEDAINTILTRIQALSKVTGE